MADERGRLLDDVRDALQRGDITWDDLERLRPPAPEQPGQEPLSTPECGPAVDDMLGGEAGRARLAARFWPKVNKDGPVPAHRPELGPCWVWTAAMGSRGYGAVKVTGGAVVGAHRVAWMLSRGVGWDPEFLVLHHCDNRACCNPDHLFSGTYKDNYDDMVAKGRGWQPVVRPVVTGVVTGVVSHLATEEPAHNLVDDGNEAGCERVSGVVPVVRPVVPPHTPLLSVVVVENSLSDEERDGPPTPSLSVGSPTPALPDPLARWSLPEGHSFEDDVDPLADPVEAYRRVTGRYPLNLNTQRWLERLFAEHRGEALYAALRAEWGSEPNPGSILSRTEHRLARSADQRRRTAKVERQAETEQRQREQAEQRRREEAERASRIAQPMSPEVEEQWAATREALRRLADAPTKRGRSSVGDVLGREVN